MTANYSSSVTIIFLCFTESSTCVHNYTFASILFLTKYATQSNTQGVGVQREGASVIDRISHYFR